MKYTVIKIEEDLDYGCEERETPLALVTLKDDSGAVTSLKYPDQELLDQKIEEGSVVILDEQNRMQPALDRDWTKNCNTSNVDVQKFTDMMTRVKAGETIDWICPFCGGEVGLLEQQDGHTVIGCHSCDMRITIS